MNFNYITEHYCILFKTESNYRFTSKTDKEAIKKAYECTFKKCFYRLFKIINNQKVLIYENKNFDFNLKINNQ